MNLDEIGQLKSGARVRLPDGKPAIYRGRVSQDSVWLEYPPTRGMLQRSVELLLDPQCEILSDLRE